MVKGIVFDLGGVIVKFHFEKYKAYLNRITGLSIAEVNRVVTDFRDKFETSKIDESEYEKYLARRLNIGLDKIQWFEFYKKNVELNYDVLELVSILHKSYRTGYLTNIDRPRHMYTVRILDLDLFDYKFTSFSIGYRKPDPRIFRYVLKMMRLKPEELLFIDNEIANIRGARKLGIKALLFRNRRELDINLGKLGI